MTASRLPDPTTHASFYKDVPVKRLIAWFIDGVVTFGLAALLALLTFGLLFFVFFGFWTIVSLAYRTITISAGSATPGMRFAGIEFRDAQGQRFDGGLAFFHSLGTVISFSTGAQIVSIAMMLLTPKGQGLVDFVLGTTALNKRARY